MSSDVLTFHPTRLAHGIAVGNGPAIHFDPALSFHPRTDHAAVLWRFLRRSGMRLIDINGAPALWRTTGVDDPLNSTVYAHEPIAHHTDLRPHLTPVDGDEDEASSLSMCYLAGTLIMTPDGERPVERLTSGDRVIVHGGGSATLVWTNSSHVTTRDLDLAPNRRPVVIRAGALGRGLPRRDVLVSAQHRVVVADADGAEFLASARHLMMAGMPGVEAWRDRAGFTLVHVACADHHVILAEGAAMESFFTGPQAVRALPLAKRIGLFATFPSLIRGINPMNPARPFIRHRDVAAILRRNLQRRHSAIR